VTAYADLVARGERVVAGNRRGRTSKSAAKTTAAVKKPAAKKTAAAEKPATKKAVAKKTTSPSKRTRTAGTN
jgi:hypothetical protein